MPVACPQDRESFRETESFRVTESFRETMEHPMHLPC